VLLPTPAYGIFVCVCVHRISSLSWLETCFISVVELLVCCVYVLIFSTQPVHQELEQGRHELRLKLTSCQSQWESQVGDLERDVRELSGQVERLTQAVTEAEREKGLAQQEHAEHTQRLREQLSTVSTPSPVTLRWLNTCALVRIWIAETGLTA